MEQNRFFTGTNRRIVLGSPTLQSTSRRICIPIRMPLSGESVIGMPDWLGEAYTAVSKFASEMTPEVEQIADIVLAFDSAKPADGLFELPAAKVPQAELRSFNVQRAGDAEDPDVELAFKAYMPYARDFWAWIGEMAGKEVYMAFPSSLGNKVVSVSSETQMTLDTPGASDEAAILANDTKPEDDPGTPQFEARVKKSLGADAAGPRMVGDTPQEKRNEHRPRKNGKELAEYNAQQEAKEAKPSADDAMLPDAVRVVFEIGKASTALLQRRLRIGYSRAVQLLDLMERDGLIGAAAGSGPREVLKAPAWLTAEQNNSLTVQ